MKYSKPYLITPRSKTAPLQRSPSDSKRPKLSLSFNKRHSLARYLKVLAISALALGVAACSTAGPFVTHVYPSGPDRLSQQKCMVHFNAFTGVVSTGQCNTSEIVLVH